MRERDVGEGEGCGEEERRQRAVVSASGCPRTGVRHQEQRGSQRGE